MSSWDGIPPADVSEGSWVDIALIVAFAAVVIAIGIFAAGGPS